MNTHSFISHAAPVTEKEPFSDTRHGITRDDAYHWLRAANWQDVLRDPSLLDIKIRNHLEAENNYQSALMTDTKELQQHLFAEMKGRIKEDDSSVPAKDGAYAYGISYVTGGQHPQYFRIPRDGGERTILIDGDKEAAALSYFSLGGLDYSPDHQSLAWSADTKGSEFYDIKIRDLTTLEDKTDLLTATAGGTVWDAQSKGVFYVQMDDNHRPAKLFYHSTGTSQDQDALIYEEKDAGFFMNVSGSSLHDYVFINIQDHETSEVWLIPANDPQAKPQLVAARETGIEYNLSEGGDVFYILTNIDGAKDFKIMSAPVSAPQKQNWTEVVAEKSGTIILDIAAYKNHLVWLERNNGLPRIVIRERDSGREHAIAFDEEAYSLGLQGSAEYDTDVIRFSYSSMTTPSQLYDYNMASRERVLLKTQEVPSGHVIDDYVTRRVLAPAPDGQLVPVSILAHKDTPMDGSAPCLLYGYGAYGSTIPASFSTSRLSLVDRGFIYAIAHVRGGKDKGFSWYENGKREHKVNTFTDFIAAARHLVSENVTSHDRIIAHGGSAGGMLMGAIVNMAPEAFGGIIADVPFVDVLNTMLDDSLPLTPPEWPEWGNPIASETDYRTIAAYSPYDNVDAKNYPPILATAGLTDPRVTYWEAAKWVAKLREKTTGNNPVLFKINMEAGHGGVSGRFSQLEEIAYNYAFALKVADKL
ncbi:S9 family peptidase [Pseudochrobactrum sp. sp1633]|uniref:S9 family peptidase n=1 Tax=Pseudochrobactrum sp. sp1633 TaxID=3036706 RepID=UPI0025A66D4D|nr:S9 family peptidase [Pseudochrobactrum sp. sp1633]MDM8345196.1 S9 family peptidase [Pseudochrobactrum sp. sp1633]HWD12953.1 S9 family peptidase [Pseudochrobactrum sp.]